MGKHQFFPSNLTDGKVVFENGQGAMIISTLAEVYQIAEKGNPDSPMASAKPTQEQAKMAVKALGL